MAFGTRAIVTSLLGLLTWGMSASASAQLAPSEGFRLDRLSPAPTPDDGFALTLPQTLGHLHWSSMVSFGYARKAFVLRGPPDEELVAHRLGGDLSVAIGLFNAFEAYARLPFMLASVGRDARFDQTALTAPRGGALGDAALGGTLYALQLFGIGVGVRGELLLPTGNQPDLMGDYAVEPRGHLLAAYELGRLTVGAEGGAVYRPHRDYGPVRIGPEAEWTLGARVHALEAFDVYAETFGTSSLRRPAGAAALDTLDLLVGARHRAPVGPFVLRTGGAAGVGISDAAGDPSLRILFNVALTSAEGAQNDPRAHAGSALLTKP